MNKDHMRRSKKLLSRGLPAIKPREEGIVFGIDGCLRLVRGPLGWAVMATRDLPASTLLIQERPLVAALFLDPDIVHPKMHRIAAMFPGATTKNGVVVSSMLLRGVTEKWLSHFASTPCDESDAVDVVRDVAEILKKYRSTLIRPESASETLQRITRICEVLKANAFMVHTPVMNVEYAHGLYDRCSLFNHSCRANATAFNEGKVDSLDLLVSTVQDIPKGQEIFVSYGHGMIGDVRYRRAAIQNMVGFQCACQRCIEESKKLPNGGTAMSCPEDIFALFHKAQRLHGPDAYKNYHELVKTWKEGIDGPNTDPKIRLHIVIGYTIGLFQWGQLKDGLAPEDVAWLVKHLERNQHTFQLAGPSIALHIRVYIHLLAAVRQLLLILRRDADKIDVPALADHVDKAIKLLNFIYSGRYDMSMDLETSTFFKRLVRTVEILGGK